MKLPGWIAGADIDHYAALNRPTVGDELRPALDVLVFMHGEEGPRILVGLVLREPPVPGPDRHVGDRVVLAGHILAVGQMTVEYVHLPLRLHGVAVDCV